MCMSCVGACPSSAFAPQSGKAGGARRGMPACRNTRARSDDQYSKTSVCVVLASYGGHAGVFLWGNIGGVTVSGGTLSGNDYGVLASNYDARNASSSCKAGTPNMAMTASPMYFSTVPL